MYYRFLVLGLLASLWVSPTLGGPISASAQLAAGELDSLRGRVAALGPGPERVHSRLALARAEFLASTGRDYAEARRAADEAQALGLDSLEATARLWLANAALFRGAHRTALRYADTADTLFAAIGDTLGLARTRLVRSNVHREQGRYALAAQDALDAVRFAELRGDSVGMGRTLATAGMALVALGEPGEAVPYLRRAIALKERHDRGTLHITEASLAAALKALGEASEAIAVYERALERARDDGRLSQLGGASSALAELYVLTGRVAAARRLYEQNMELLQRHSAPLPSMHVSTYLGFARLALAEGELEAAHDAAQEALRSATRYGLVGDRVTAWRLMGQVAAARGDADASSAAFERALILQDTLYAARASESVARLRDAYSIERQELEIGLLEQQASAQAASAQRLRWVLFTLAGVILLLLTVLAALAVQNRRRRKAEAEASAQAAELVRRQEQLETALQTIETRNEALSESEARFRHVVEDLHEAVLHADASGVVRYLSPGWERLAGFPGEGQPLHALFVPEDQADVAGAAERATLGDDVEFEARLTRADGELRWIEARLRPLRHGDGFSGTLADVTESHRFAAERAARERAEEAERLKSALLYAVSHELRTPLTPIAGLARSILEEAQDPLSRDLAASIARSADRLTQTVETAVLYAQIESDELRVRLLPTDVAGIVRDLLPAAEAAADAKGIELRVGLPSPPPSAWADPTLFAHVAAVLLENALKFTERGHVEVGLEVDDDRVTYCVTDTGIGMNEEQRQALFEPFRQASEGIARTHEGLGLGLTLAGHLIQRMDGTLDVESTPGEGTTIRVSLQRFEPTPVPDAS